MTAWPLRSKPEGWWQVAPNDLGNGAVRVDVQVDPHGLLLSPAEAREFATALLDAAEEIDPCDEDDEPSQWEIQLEAEQRAYARRHEAELARKIDARSLLAQLAAEVRRLPGGLSVRQPAAYHLQVMRGGRVFADWWPSKGTTRAARAVAAGPKCHDVAALVRWLRELPLEPSPRPPAPSAGA